MARILVTNDDGINATGLRALVRALVQKGHEVYVAAPECERSGASKSVFFKASVRETMFEGVARAWTVKAPPASIVYIAVNALLPEKPDIVVSGLNHGPNMGFEDFLTSGTIGAAIEASLMGIPAVAGSITKWRLEGDQDAAIPAEITSEIASALAEPHVSNALGDAPLIIVNSPPKPKGVLATRMAWNTYRVKLEYSKEGIILPRMEFHMIYDQNASENTDIWAVLNGYASITLVDLRRVYEAISSVEDAHARVLGVLKKRVEEKLNL